jgi:hypothetical protein
MPNSPEWEVIDDDLEVSCQPLVRHETPFRLLAFSVDVDDYKAVVHFPNHWNRYDTWKEVLPPVRTMFPSCYSSSYAKMQPDSNKLSTLNKNLRSVLTAGPAFVTSRSLRPRLLDLDATRHRPELEFDIETQLRLSNRNKWLNTSAVDNTARLLQCRIQDCPHKLYHIAADCAILPSTVISTIENNASDYDLYRACMRSRWWATHVWLVPIHRVNHWVLGIVNHHLAEIWFYDSLGEENGKARRMDELRVRAPCYRSIDSQSLVSQILHCLLRRLDAIARERKTFTMVRSCPYRPRLLMVSASPLTDNEGFLIS